MKTVFIFINITALLISSTSPELQTEETDYRVPHHLVSLLQRCSNTCKTKTKVSEDDIQCIKANEIPETSSGLCYLQCMMEKLGIVVKNRFLKNGVMTTFAPAVRNCPEKKNLLRKASEECSEEQKTWKIEQCGDLAYNILKCFEGRKGDLNLTGPLSQIKL